MNAGKSYTFREFVYWTRRHIYKLFFLALIPTVLYHLGLTFLSITWVPVALLGTAVSFIVGFKNNTSYSRAWEARTIYGSIVNGSRAFAVMIRDFLQDEAETKAIFHRHFAWLTALRLLINGDQEMGSFCEVRSFDVLDLSTGVNTNLMDDFFS
jgi:ion channel-forming bestrophin family protein